MKLDPLWFVMGYYVYVVVMKYEGSNRFYIGMIGDRKHLTARSPFYRMTGHFMLGGSTQNQIIKGIKAHLNIAEVTDKVLCQIQFIYYAWLLQDFIKGDFVMHPVKRSFAEKVESCLIDKMRVAFGRLCIFNGKGGLRKSESVSDVAEEIFTDLIKRI